MEVVRCLAESGLVDIDEGYENGKSPLHLACQLGLTKIVQYLVEEAKADITKRAVDENNWGALHFAVAHGNVETAEYLCQKHGNLLDSLDDGNRTPLHIACQKYSLEMVKCISQKLPENINSINNKGNLPIHCAAGSAKKLENRG